MSCAPNSITQTSYVCEGHCFRGRVAAVCCPVGSGSQSQQVCFIGLAGIRVLCGTVCIGAVAPSTLPNPCGTSNICGVQPCYRPPCGLVSGGWVVLGGKSKCYSGQWNSSCCGSSNCEPTSCLKWSLEYPVTAETPLACAQITDDCTRPRWYRLGEGVVTIQTGAGAIFQLLDVEATASVLQPTIASPWTFVNQFVATSLIPVVTPLIPIPVYVTRSIEGSGDQPLGPCSGAGLLYAITPDLEQNGNGNFAAVISWGTVASTISGTYLSSGGSVTFTVLQSVASPIGSGVSAFARILYPGDAVLNNYCTPCCPKPLQTAASPCGSDDTLVGLTPAPCTILPQGIQYCGCPEAPVHSYARNVIVGLSSLSALDAATRDFCSPSSCENAISNQVPAASVDRLVGVVPYADAVPTGALSLVLQPAAQYVNPILPQVNDQISIVAQYKECPLPEQPYVQPSLI